MQIVYTIAIHGYRFLIWIFAFFHKKAKLWIAGRENIFSEIEETVDAESKIVWIHCASLGEFEQGRPIIESIKKDHPTFKILLTFFSPSGYEIRKNYSWADYIFYLPIDTPSNAKRFVDLIQPDFAIFVKYEFWYHYLHELSRRSIPTYLISAIFHTSQPFFSSIYGRFFRSILFCYDLIFVQNQASADLLKKIKVTNFEVVGDTRIDRVLQIADTPSSLPIIEQFKGDAPILVCGSTWQPDEKILASYINQDRSQWKYIIAPHDVTEAHLKQIELLLQVPYQRYSQSPSNIESKVLMIDSIGLLSQIYQYGKLAYIGGGFGVGIHNTLEPIAFGLPVFFGPKYEKFEEAVQLVKSEGAFVIRHQKDFEMHFEAMQQEEKYSKASKAVMKYLEEGEGATPLIMQRIFSQH